MSEKEIKEKAQIELGTNIFRTTVGKTEQLIREDKRIKDVWVKRELPDRILIQVEEKKPALWMNLPDGLFGLSQDQEIIPLEEEDLKRDLPLVTGLAPLSGSEKENQSICPYKRWANAKAKFALDFYKTLLEEDSSLMGIISEMSLFEENNLILYLIPRGIQVNMGEGNFKKKLKRVKAILEYEGKRDDLACIDLRFKDQVVLTRSSPGMPQSSSQKPNNQVAQMRGKAFGGKENL